MDQHPAPPSPASPTPDRAHWTPAKQRIFVVALLETGCVTRAARAAGMSRSSAHRLRARLAGPFGAASAPAAPPRSRPAGAGVAQASRG